MSGCGVSTELPEGWAWATLDEVAVWGSGGTPKAGVSAFYDGEIPWAVIGDLNDGVVNVTARRITQSGLENSAAKIVPAGSLLLAMYGSIGKMGVAGIDMATNQAIAFAVPRSDAVDTSYLFYYLLGQRDDLAAKGKGATQKNISQQIIKAWPLPLPPLEEQRRIVAVLEDHLAQLARGVELLQASLRKLSVYGERLLLEACNGKLLGLLPAAEQSTPSTADCIDGELSALPEGWTWSRLGEFAEVVGGITKDAKKQSDPELPEVPYLRVANVQRGRLDLSNIATIRATPSKVSALTLQSGDVLLNEGGDRDKLGRGWIWEGQIEGCIHQNHVFRARIRGGVLSSKILAWHANSFGRHWFEVNGKQSVNLASISLRKIKQFPVPIPPQAHQERIVQEVERQLSVIESAEKIVRAALGRATSLRRSLLAEAFAGRLVPQDPADEPATALLDRIRTEREATGAAKSKRRSPRRAPTQRENAPAADAPPPPRADGPALTTATQPTLDLEMPS
ncbi:restriction endonuclease subunit S [Streptomyces sp. MRC013]|uniref:restriction endonuclease subunit S n=1 Tax=Streptomyces sp. MRC013 TaxID=2898276 RepID=UPI0024E265AE|nr:restriction endonuclease subunit S [Streptomyces sp. MRC013]